jgi:3-oxoadipate enol-lactonase
VSWSAKAAALGSGRIPYLDTGDPKSPHVLLLVHAFPVGMRVWEPVTVPPGWRAIAPALPGFDGAAPPASDSTSIDDYARCVLELMDDLRVDGAVLGGLSMGGYVAFALWRLDRLRWRGFVLADTRAGADTDAGRAARNAMLQTLDTRGTHGVADEMLPKLLGKTTREQRPELVQHVRRLIERQTNEGVRAAALRLRDRPDSTPLLPEIGVPALVIVGDEDEVTPLSEAEILHSRLPDAHLARVTGAGHLSCLENPAAFNGALAAFLSSIRG